MKWYSQSFTYDDPWSTVALAYYLRYPNPYASHILSCDVINRTITPSGTLRTSRLILKRGILPKWAPKGIISRAESWVIEESDVDPHGKVVRCVTRNLDHVKVLQIIESVSLTEGSQGKTLQRSEAQVISRFGWGLARRIETFGITRLKSHFEKSREGVSLIVKMIRESRLQPFAIGPTGIIMDRSLTSYPRSAVVETPPEDVAKPTPVDEEGQRPKAKGWFPWR
ncbi:hypothetical protein M422DRAFT_227448 [Sphaerobolus stellatus SS14]|uniref:PRELI/MSF1 domain-containing protein n=1 Tax=Sphaerobolus stellatus (strain SS14) TaxID=990650 RepID=A0A0C9W3E8_SPHS4|nr:hypothetical protein M422DRAFT_227448 [Sphaerobolus stellatus SS14]